MINQTTASKPVSLGKLDNSASRFIENLIYKAKLINKMLILASFYKLKYQVLMAILVMNANQYHAFNRKANTEHWFAVGDKITVAIVKTY